MQTAQYILDYFFDWSQINSIIHFIALVLLCYMLRRGDKNNIDINFENGESNQQQGEAPESDSQSKEG